MATVMPESPADARAREIEQQLTDDERFSLIISLLGPIPGSFVGPRDPRIPEGVENVSAGYTPGVPRLGVPVIQSSDASMGITNPGYRPDDPGATAFPHRREQWDCLILSQWDRPEDDAANIAWTRAFYAAMTPHLERDVYVNDLGDDEADRVAAAYGPNLGRLAAIKMKYDPENFFQANQNVAPASNHEAAGGLPLPT